VAVLTDGTVRAWGYNGGGQLGNNSFTNSPVAVQVVGQSGTGVLSGIRTGRGSVAAGWYHSLAIRDADGSIWAWGYNASGQLGNGSTTSSNRPVQVLGPVGTSGPLTGVVAVTCGVNHSLALKADGSVWAWGLNDKGQLGDGTTQSSSRPVRVRDTTGSGVLTGATAITAGAGHSVAIVGTGSVFAWGWNLYGQLGNGRPEDSLTPRPVAGLPAITAIAAGNVHTMARGSNGTVWTWGNNYFGQIGDGTKTDRRTPVQVTGVSGISTVAAGDGFSLALRSDATVASWGHDLFGSLGDGASGQGADKAAPVSVRDLSNVTDIAGGYGHGIALGRRLTVR
jgi:alpha-tubulin suppressor-like RCC1 family protein